MVDVTTYDAYAGATVVFIVTLVSGYAAAVLCVRRNLIWAIVIVGCAVALVIILTSITVARAADAPPVPTCRDIRTYVQQFGESLVLAQARAGGLTDVQIERLRRECAPVQQEKKR